MAPLVESMEPRKVRTYEEKLCDAQEEAADLNWIHYLGQYCILHTCIVPYTIVHRFLMFKTCTLICVLKASVVSSTYRKKIFIGI